MGRKLGWVALVLLVVGGLNWGLVGLLNFDLVAALMGPQSVLSRLVYTLVGVSAAYLAFAWRTLSRPAVRAGA
jgi:uncharacterized membrane protein YuzA (DUF378 family)